MIRLSQCNKNSNHWHSAHASRCPWCSVLQDQGREIFPPPGERPAGRSPVISGPPDTPETRNVLLPQAGPPAVPANIPTNIWLAGIIGLVVVAVIVAFFMMPASEGNTPAPVTVAPTYRTTVAITSLPTTMPETVAPDPTDPSNGMNIYKNDAYRFSLDYPAGWNVGDGTGIVSFSPTKDLAMEISRGYSSGTLQDYFLQNAKRITTNTENDVMNHDFKTNIGYRIDYRISQDDSISKTRVTEIYTQEQSGSDILVITISGSENAYNRYSGDLDAMIRSFKFQQ